MITRDEIEQKAKEFEISTINVERDYIFGWIIAGLFLVSDLKSVLIFKGGNCFRKAYFEMTRFSDDLDFAAEIAIAETQLGTELNKVCDFVQEMTGVIFDKEKNRIFERKIIDNDRKVYRAKIFFKDFYGNQDEITICITLDVTQFEKVYLPLQTRHLIHPYSDNDQCKVELQCLKLEELVASKLKCLLQRRNVSDLFDYVFSVFIKRDIEVNQKEIVSTFLKKTIFERSPGVVKSLLLGLPFEVFRKLWAKGLICPKQSIIDFDTALNSFKGNIEELFGHFQIGRGDLGFFPAHLRNPIIDAGCSITLLKVIYDGVERTVEPYSLVYKKRKDGVAQEYFYVYDRTGGRTSPPGIKTFVASKIQSIECTSESFIPQCEVELSKAGEYSNKLSFSRGSSFQRGKRYKIYTHPFIKQTNTARFVIQCPYCGKEFKRLRTNTRLNQHTDKYGNRCFGRIGIHINTIYN